MLGKYIKSKNKYILLFLLYLGIFCLIAYLYDMPIDACLYAMALCLFFAVEMCIRDRISAAREESGA